MEPNQITVIVHGAKNLQGKKKGRHKYNVVFGVGTNRYRTATEQDPTGNPVWTEESVIEVENGGQPLVFIVKEKDDVLGQVTVPLSSLPDETRRAKRRFPLQPHRKCSHPQGELIFEGWVSRVRELQPPTIKVTCEPATPARLNPFVILKETIQKSPMMGRKSHHVTNNKSTSSVITLHRRNSHSLQDLSTSNQEWSAEDTPSKIRPKTLPAGLLGVIGGDMAGKRCSSYMDLSCTVNQPQIVSISPCEGTADGGTLVTITGRNLGNNVEDVVGLFICGANCLGSVEYESSTRLRCTTKSWRTVKGYIVVETQSGGRGTSLIQYRFVDTPRVGAQEEDLNETPKFKDSEVDGRCPKRALVSTPEPKRRGILARLHDDSKHDRKDAENVSKKDRTNGKGSSSSKEDSFDREDMSAEIQNLRDENKRLRDENATMKLYIDHLVARVMEECPDALSTQPVLRT